MVRTRHDLGSDISCWASMVANWCERELRYCDGEVEDVQTVQFALGRASQDLVPYYGQEAYRTTTFEVIISLNGVEDGVLVALITHILP